MRVKGDYFIHAVARAFEESDKHNIQRSET